MKLLTRKTEVLLVNRGSPFKAGRTSNKKERPPATFEADSTNAMIDSMSYTKARHTSTTHTHVPTEIGVPSPSSNTAVVTPKASNLKIDLNLLNNNDSSHERHSSSSKMDMRTEHEQLKLQLRDASRVVRAVLGVDPASSQVKLDGNASIKAVRKYAAMKRELKRLRTDLATARKALQQIKGQDVSFDNATATPIKVADEEMDKYRPVVSPEREKDDEDLATSRRLSFPPPSSPAIGLMAIEQQQQQQQQQQNSSSPTASSESVSSSSSSSRSVTSAASGSSLSADAREISMRQETLKSQNEQIQVLSELIQGRQERIERLQAELGDDAEANDLADSETYLRRLLDQSHDEILELEKERQYNMQEIVELNKQLRDVTQLTAQQITDLQEMCEERRARVETLEQERLELVTSVEELTRQLEESKALVEELQEHNGSAENDIFTKLELVEMQMKEGQVEPSQQEELRLLRLQVRTLRKLKKKKGSRSEAKALQNKMRDQAARLLLTQLLDRDAKLERITLELEAKEQEVENLRAAVEQHGKFAAPEHEDRIKELEAENRKNIARMSILTEQLNKSSEAVEMLMGELGQIREEEERSKLELDNLRAHLEEARLKASDASKELETIRSGTEEDRSAEVEDLTKQLQDALSEIATLSQEVETKRAYERSRAKERNDLMGQLVITRAVQDSLTNAVAEARTKDRASTNEMIELMSTGSVDISRGGETSDEEDNKSLSAEDANGGDGNDTRLMRDELLELRTRLEEAQMNVEELEQERNYNLAKVSELNKLLDITKADDTTKELHAKAMECARLNTEVDKLTSDLRDCNGKIEKLEQEREVYKAKVEDLSSVWDTHTKAIEAEKHLRENLQEVERQLSASRERSQQLQRERELTIEKAASLSIRVAESRAKIDDLTEQLEYERKFSAGQAIGRRSKHGLGSSIHSTVSALSMHSASEMKLIEPLGEEESAISEEAASGRKSPSIFLPFVRGRKQSSSTVLDEKARIRELEAIVARQENTIVKLRSKSGSSDDNDDDLADEEIEVIDMQPSSRSSEDADAAAGSILSSGMTKEQAQELTIQRLMKQVEESDINATEPASVAELLAKIKKLEEDNAEYSIKVESLQSTLEEVAHENVARSIKIMALEQEYKENSKKQQHQQQVPVMVTVDVDGSPEKAEEPEPTLDIAEREAEAAEGKSVLKVFKDSDGESSSEGEEQPHPQKQDCPVS